MTFNQNATDMEKREKALAVLSELITPEQVAGIAKKMESDDFGSDYLDMTLRHCYGDVWSRDGLTRKERSLVTLGVLIGLKAAPEMVHQFKIAIRNGLTPRQIEEVIIQAETYVGIPAANLADSVAAQSLGEMGIKLKDRGPND